jgi:Cysteine-rich secretory protein family
MKIFAIVFLLCLLAVVGARDQDVDGLHHIVKNQMPLQMVDVPERVAHVDENKSQHVLRSNSISVSPTTVQAGGSVTVTYTADSKVWIGFFAPGSISTSLFKYLDAQSGSTQFQIPMAMAGPFNVAVIDQGTNLEKTSTLITVAAAVSTSCGDLPDAVADTAMLALHNSRRQARGLSTNLVWSSTITEYAKRYAEQLRCLYPNGDGLSHSSSGTTYRRAGDGENLALGYASAAGAIVGWVEEEEDAIDLSCHYACGCPGGCDGCASPSNAVIGHATQSLWSTTTQMGCARATTANGHTFYVCQYFKSGNCCGYDYQTGRVCS